MFLHIGIKDFALITNGSANIDESSGNLLLDVNNILTSTKRITIATADGEIRYTLAFIGGCAYHHEKFVRIIADTREHRERIVFTRKAGQEGYEYCVEFTIGENTETWNGGLLQICGDKAFLRIELGNPI